MAKKNKYEGMTQQQIESFKLEKKYTMILAVVFMFMIFLGVILSTTNACGWYTEEELRPTSATSVSQSDEV